MIDDDDRILDGQYRDRLRSTLQTMVKDEATPKRRHLNRPAIILAVSATAAAAIVTVALPMMGDRAAASLEVACLDSADPVAVAGAATAETVTLTPGPDGLTVRDVEAACTALWVAKTRQQGSVDFQSGAQPSTGPITTKPTLVVCTLPDGRPGVLPGQTTTCTVLGMELWRFEP
ncbi:hypothetical protein [Agromyces humatus]|uniref:Uncharacterized protein n=1 Tax=Agromyces humatus TaxID=279573 RepID=A0ABN2KVL3_9MICO|nr:hypothetical protein [Agromyces humatus]